MDEAGIDVVVDLDGGWGEDILLRHLDACQAMYPDRFRHFGGIDWARWQEHGAGFADWAAGRLEIQASRGASGVKIWKQFGLNVVDANGSRATVDDPSLDPVWGQLAPSISRS